MPIFLQITSPIPEFLNFSSIKDTTMSIPWPIGSSTRRNRPAILRPRNAPAAPILEEKNIQKSCSGNTKRKHTVDPGSNENKENATTVGTKILKGFHKKRTQPLQNITSNRQDTSVTECLDPINTMLPEEIRHFIFEKLSFKELLVCRAVSKTWRKSVESFQKFHVIIDDSKDFSGTCNVRMKICEIQTLMASRNRHLFQATTPDSVEIVKRISQWNFGEMATKWNDLTTLRIGWKALISVFMFRNCAKYPTEEQIDVEGDQEERGRAACGFLPDLECIFLEVATSVDGEIFKILNQNLGYLLQWHYPSLVHITVSRIILERFIFYSCESCDYPNINFLDNSVRQELLSKVSSFVRGHAPTLKKIDIQFSNLNRRIPRCIPQRSLLFDTEIWNWKNRTQILKGHAIKLSEYSLEYPYKNPEIEIEDNSEKWQKILQRERQFELLIISKLQLNIRRAEYFYFFIKMYSEQLTIIELINLSVYDIEKQDKMTPIDINLFRDCVNLKTLGLWRAPILLNEVLPEASSEIINLSCLPKSISSLTIDGLPVQSVDILTTIKKLKHLSKLCYSRAAMPRRNHLPQSGVTLEVLVALMTHPRLAKIDVMTASSVPRDFYSDRNIGFSILISKNKWSIQDIRQLWYNCVKISMVRDFTVKKIP